MDHLNQLIVEALWHSRRPWKRFQPDQPGHQEAMWECERDAYVVAAAIRADRTITTVAQADALPVGSIIRDQDDEGLTRVRGGWACDGPYSPYPSSSVLAGGATATLLYRPDEDGE